jgi:ADP-heptose:LPS heptosyltransferase
MSINIGTMRRIDYYLGVPLCFMGTIVLRFFSLLFHLLPSRGKKAPCRNILFIGLSETGSTILADPSMMKIQDALNVNLYFASFEKNSPVLELLGTIPRKNIFKIRDSGIVALVRDASRFFFWTREMHIDTVIDLELFSRFTALLTGFSGAVRTVGFHAFYNEGLYRGGFLTHKVAYNSHQHMSKNFIALVNALLSEKKEVPYSKTVIADSEIKLRKITVSEQAKISMLGKVTKVFPRFDEQHHKVVLFNTNASDLVPLRRWPKEYFIALAELILGEHPRVIILLPGVDYEYSWNDSIVRTLKSDRCVNFAGKTVIAELPALYAVSEFMVSNDSGPAHFASVTSMPAFVLFGPETPALYGPLGTMTPIYAELACSPCVSAANHRKSACNDNVCLQVITPEMVFDIIKPSLDALYGEGDF